MADPKTTNQTSNQDTKNQTALTEEQIKAIREEAETFSQKSIQYASSSPALSAHYSRLYRAAMMIEKRIIRAEKSAKLKKHAAERKAAREKK